MQDTEVENGIIAIAHVNCAGDRADGFAAINAADQLVYQTVVAAACVDLTLNIAAVDDAVPAVAGRNCADDPTIVKEVAPAVALKVYSKGCAGGFAEWPKRVFVNSIPASELAVTVVVMAPELVIMPPNTEKSNPASDVPKAFVPSKALVSSLKINGISMSP
ncbi:MAG: hypothetical protein P8P70_05535 [Sulfitobacter sp.]|nr:hypothetical protein [Sulfitobacter sp.]